jgi:hypothetical protein
MELLLLVTGSLAGYVLGGVMGWRALAFPAAVCVAILATADSADGPPAVAMAILAAIALATATAAGSIAGGSPDE